VVITIACKSIMLRENKPNRTTGETPLMFSTHTSWNVLCHIVFRMMLSTVISKAQFSHVALRLILH